MISRHPMRVATLASVLLVATLSTTSPSAAAQESDADAVRFSGEWICVAVAPTRVTTDPDDPTRVTGGEFESLSEISGDFVGVDHTVGTFTLDPDTSAITGYVVDTFHGVYAPDGAAGIMRREGPFQGNLATNEFFYEQRITGGTGDFEASRGHQTAPGAGLPGVPCMGSSGTYKGAWHRP